MNKPGPAAIEVRNVVKRFGTVTALDDVSLSIPAGEMFFLLGPSGCGKTTLLRILAGLEIPDSGAVLFNGKDVAELPAHERGAPMVFQNYALWPHLNVRDNVAFGLVERHVAKQEIQDRTEDVLKRVGLAGLGARMPGQLSGGQQQRLCIARALAVEPEVILMDEPTSAIDPIGTSKIEDLIFELKRKYTIVIVTHNMQQAGRVSDYTAFFFEGRIIEYGKTEQVFQNPSNKKTEEYITGRFG